ncbi:MAG: rRNA synthase [Clostridiales bacterium]|jgi:23S rRNA pseudouridine1911/1915/1917 synthase|nr:RluA family pseudouridine synthase [Oscillospiraceae bacterium]MDN5378246.1 rRNA synthase [Clostridiales bacterium]
MRKITFLVGEDFSGRSVEAFLMKGCGISRRLLLKLKRTDMGILKNGEHARSVDVVKEGDRIEISLEDEKTLEANPALCVPVVYEDEDVIVFDKPAGMPVHPSHGHQGDTLGNFFAHICPGVSFRPVNRLDRDTSGLCAAAKNAHAAKIIGESLDKTYFAIVCGEIFSSGVIDAPIAREKDSIILRRVDFEKGQRAVTLYEPVLRKNGFTLLKIKLETGRTHQIRVHFAHMGFPLVGDGMYGGDTSLLKRQALHCGEVSFLHPVSGEELSFSSPLPDDIKWLVDSE